MMEQRKAGLEEMAVLLKGAGYGTTYSHGRRLGDSGRNTLVTAGLITRLLTREYASKDREVWISLLPAGGEDGTLEHRLCCIRDGRGIRAKTGTLSRAIALSGYAETKTSGTLAFSVLVNDFSAPSADVRAWVDKIALALLE